MSAGCVLALVAALVASAVARPVAGQEIGWQVTIRDILTSPAAFDGQVVTVTGVAEEILGPRSFVLVDDAGLSLDALPVISSSPILGGVGQQLGAEVLANQVVRVTGTVLLFDLATFEDRLDLDLDDRRFAGWAGRPAIVARVVTPLEWEGVPTGPVVRAPVRAQPGQAVEVERIIDNPAAFYGRRVTVNGLVDEVLGPRSFELEDYDLLFDDEVLMVTPGLVAGRAGRPLDLGALEDRELIVTGTVRRFDRTTLGNELGLDFTADAFADWDGRPAIVAESIRIGIPGAGRPYGAYPYSPDPYSRFSRPPLAAPYYVDELGQSVDMIRDDPSAYYGRVVTLAAQVGDILGPRSFTLEDDDVLFDEEIPVISSRPVLGRGGQALDLTTLDDRIVQVTGTVRRLNLFDIEGDLGLDLNDAAFEEWEGEPIIVAESIRLLPPYGGVRPPGPVPPPPPGAPRLTPLEPAIIPGQPAPRVIDGPRGQDASGWERLPDVVGGGSTGQQPAPARGLRSAY